MQTFEQRFIDLALSAEALCFGEFTLKSGRVSPYFFNAGRFCTGSQLAELGYCYAAKIAESGIKFDVLFGPAYKGIPLAAVTAAALATHFDINTPFAFDRKEPKDHGEGGIFVGANVSGRILVIDDVITAGTAIREVASKLEQNANAEICGVVVGLDRQETVSNQGDSASRSAVEAVSASLGVKVHSIINVERLLEYLSNNGDGLEQADAATVLSTMQNYRKQYGC